MTGGRAELGSFRWRLAYLDIEVDGLTIYGRPPRATAGSAGANIAGLSTGDLNEAPWFHADRLQAKLDLHSLLRSQIGLRSLVIDKPVLHLIIYPDGSSNQPRPVGAGSAGELFQLSVGHLEVRDGTVFVNERVSHWMHERMPSRHS